MDQRLHDYWFSYSLLRYLKEFDYSYFKNLKDFNLNSVLKDQKPNFLRNFSSKWSNSYHLELCRDNNCSKAIVIDGNWKCYRMKCMFKEFQLTCKEMDPLIIGCYQMPSRGSYFCEIHENQDLAFYINNKKISFSAEQIKKNTYSKNNKVKKIWDEFYTYKDEKLYLSELEDGKIIWIDEDDVCIQKVLDFWKFKDERQYSCYTNLACKTLREKKNIALINA